VTNTRRTNCCFETLCTFAKEVQQCASCKEPSGVYGVLQNATTIKVRVWDVHIAPSSLKFVTVGSIVPSRRIQHDEICDYNNQFLSIWHLWLFYNVVWTANWPPHCRRFTITIRRITLGRIPLDEWSVRRRDLCLTTHNTHKRQSSVLSEGLEPAIPPSWRPQSHALLLRGHWDRQWIRVFDVVITVTCSTLCTYVGLLYWYLSVSFLCLHRMHTV
jgi:hypothetical protein